VIPIFSDKFFYKNLLTITSWSLISLLKGFIHINNTEITNNTYRMH
jgi:hypothetical protein